MLLSKCASLLSICQCNLISTKCYPNFVTCCILHSFADSFKWYAQHCKLFARSGNMQNLCHTLSLFHACSLNNYWLLQPKHVCFIILELMPVVVTCMYLLYYFLGFVHITCTCLFEKHVFNRGKCDTGFPVPLTCQPVYKMG